MQRRELSKALAAGAGGLALLRGASGAQTPEPGAALDVRRYGAAGDGSTDDTAAIRRVLSAGSASGAAVLFPRGYTFRVTQYLEVGPNSTIYLLGTLRLVNRSAGLFTNGGENIGIFGCKVGTIVDESVKAAYRFNDFMAAVTPAIHIRSTRNVLIHGLNILYCQQGILLSNAAENRIRVGSVRLSQARVEGCSVEACRIEFCEMSGISSYNAEDTRYADNHVHRCGDGGIWMMGARNCEVIGNHRSSPYAVPADVARYGENNPEHPTTWNDEQGIEFENCHGLQVANNVVRGMWGIGIDVKNGCNRVLIAGNRVSDCENASICVRDGDAVKNACHKVSIIGNTVSGHGTLHFDKPIGPRGAIRSADCFVTEIMNNIIYGYRTTPGIVCGGPGGYQGSWYPRNPHQGSLVVSGNAIDFKNDAFELEREPLFDAHTLGAILIEGQYDCVKCTGNKVSSDRYLSVDGRLNAGPAIELTYVSANGTYYPTCASVSGNEISNWGNWAIVVTGLSAMTSCGLAVNGNVVGGLAGGGGIHLKDTNRVLCGSNVINQIVAGAGYPGIWLEGSAQGRLQGALVGLNQITGGWQAGGNSMTQGLRLDYCVDCQTTNNSISLATQSEVGGSNVQTEPGGSPEAYHAGEVASGRHDAGAG